MKKLLVVVFLTGFLFVSCNKDSSILEPEKEFALSKQQIDQKPEEEFVTTSGYTKIRDKFSKSYTIDGDKGGKIIEKHTWTNGKDTMKLEAYLTIPKGAFDDTLTFKLVFDPNLLSVHLYPSPFMFNIPLVLDLKFKGVYVDFEIDSDSLDFQYYNPNGTFENVDYKNIKWNSNSRTLMVFDAELHHFSRYGWTRNKPTNVD